MNNTNKVLGVLVGLLILSNMFFGYKLYSGSDKEVSVSAMHTVTVNCEQPGGPVSAEFQRIKSATGNSAQTLTYVCMPRLIGSEPVAAK